MTGNGERKYGVWHDESDMYPNIWSFLCTFIWLAVPVVAFVIFLVMCITILING